MVVCFVSADCDKREIIIQIPKDSPKTKPDLFTAAQKEEMIMQAVRRQVRVML